MNEIFTETGFEYDYVSIGRAKKARRTYGFDEISLVPNGNTLDIELCDTSWQIGGLNLSTPIIASAMDSVVSPDNAGVISENHALAVLNLQGIYTRYENYNEILDQIAACSREEYVSLMRKVYQEPIKDELIYATVKKIKASGAIAAVALAPFNANRYAPILEEAGVDIIFVQVTVVGLEHHSLESKAKANPETILDIKKFCSERSVPVILGNCTDYNVALKLMDTGISGLLIGIGPGAACTSRGVLGIGVPMATSIADCKAAQIEYFKQTGKYIPVIADGGMAVGGDICKAIACGADGVMIGSPFARTKEAPGRGFHWGMATPSPVLPRGTRIQVGTECTTKELLHGPAIYDDGSQNLVGALKTSMATLGAHTIKEMQEVEVIVAPGILTEGKVYQRAQKIGMAR
ncbi:MAG: GuaB3 family IMP dehydrogenase-related protein [Vampirovibrionia bacterium]